jgi:hypothetical protein
MADDRASPSLDLHTSASAHSAFTVRASWCIKCHTFYRNLKRILNKIEIGSRNDASIYRTEKLVCLLLRQLKSRDVRVAHTRMLLRSSVSAPLVRSCRLMPPWRFSTVPLNPCGMTQSQGLCLGCTAHTPPAYQPYSATPAGAGAARRGPGSIPLLPAKTYSLRAASVFPTSPRPLDGM